MGKFKKCIYNFDTLADSLFANVHHFNEDLIKCQLILWLRFDKENLILSLSEAKRKYLTSCRTINRSFQKMRSGRLVLLELFDGHVVRFGNDAAFGYIRVERSTQPTGYEIGWDVIGQTAVTLIIVSAVQQKFLPRGVVDEGADQGPHDWEHPWRSDDQNSAK